MFSTKPDNRVTDPIKLTRETHDSNSSMESQPLQLTSANHFRAIHWPLVALAGMPLISATAEANAPVPVPVPTLQELGIYCTRHTGVVEQLESGSTISSFFFNSAEQQGDTRVCFQYGSNFYANYNILINTSGLDYPVFFPRNSFSDVYVEGELEPAPFGVTVHRRGDLYSDHRLPYSIGGSATVGSDFQFTTDSDAIDASGELTFSAWDISSRQVTVDILDDEEAEEDETIEITLHSPAEGILAPYPPQPHSAVILDNDRYPTSYHDDFHCIRHDPPLEVLENGSTIYFAEFGSSITNAHFIGADNSSEANIQCAPFWNSLVTNPNIPIYSPNIITNSQNISTTSDNINVLTSLPVIQSIENRNSSATIYFTAEPNPIGYTASCTPVNGGSPIIAHSRTSPIQVIGLTNGTTYNCTVAHFGATDASAAVIAKPVNSSPKSISTLGHWALALLSSLLALIGITWHSTGRENNAS